jgi:hypothetical protein
MTSLVTYNCFNEEDCISFIELFWKDSHSTQIFPMQTCRGLSHKGKRPTYFKWHKSALCQINPKLIDWIYREFMPMFDKDSFMWSVSTKQLQKELQCHLIGQTNN